MKIVPIFNYVITPLIINNTTQVTSLSNFKWNYFKDDLNKENLIYAFNQAKEKWEEVLKSNNNQGVIILDLTSLARFSKWFGLLIQKFDVIFKFYDKEILVWLPESKKDFEFIKDVYEMHPVKFNDFNTIAELNEKIQIVFDNLKNLWNKFNILYDDLKNIKHFN